MRDLWFEVTALQAQLSYTEKLHAKAWQIACGFAWDVGREMARLERELDDAKYAAAEAQWAANR